MKRHILIAVLLVAAVTVQAQDADSVTIEKKGSWGVNFANVGLSNWAGGGENSLAIGTVFNTSIVRKQGNGTWKNQFDFALGGAKVGEQDFRKTDDNIILLSQYSKSIRENLSWSLTGILRTQLLVGNTFEDDPDNPGEELVTKISNFMAPGYLSINLGIDHQIGKHLSISFAPAAGKFTFVSDDDLARVGAYGVDPNENVRAEFGTNLLASLSLPLMENITFTSTANFFTPYSDTFGTIDVNWETLLVMKVNKWFNATFGTQMIYDADIFFTQESGPPTRELQFKHVLNFGANFALFTSN
ncbi:hypothetical protein BFP97_08040 [Roseivirga sp. 4D4]|uniref:DUF3078 domain-containing protein n=1 Tax=Roseivirga sp. 4D4 TaxID=1889784 RepID=UPI0008535E76|nr:DUF3078 domain-containing protein [Roseivirga sp. 4D4]OEK01472.1 hypothetical protein BFP97_08040 [Roseivirga sp. 4D4]